MGDIGAEKSAKASPTTSFNEFRLFISGIPRTLDEDKVKEDFEECGEITNFKLLSDKETGESRGLAFVTYKNEAGFKAALAYDKDDYGGQTLRVRKAEEKGSATGASVPAPSSKPEGCNSVVVRKLAPEVTEKDLT